MKTCIKILLPLFLAAIMVASCQTQPEGVLADEPRRLEVMDSIAGDTTMSRQMLGVMMENQASRKIMSSNREMMDMILGNHDIMADMMTKNEEVRDYMMQTMLDSPQMMEAMLDQMQRNNMMSLECREATMGMMHERGMMHNQDPMENQ